MEKTTANQKEKVLQYMLTFGSITQLDAFRDLAVLRLASRISDLRKDGYDIQSEFETVKNRFGENVSYKRYRLNTDRKA